MADLHALATTLVNLTVKEVNELATILKDEHGIVPAAAPAAAASGPASGSAAPVAVEQTEFTVMLTSFGAAKLNVVKEVKNILGLGLKEAKDLVDAAPTVLKEKVSKDEANTLKAAMETAGASVDIK